ncbi:MAG: MFS transporter [bacterium]
MKLARKLAYSFGAVATALSYQAFSTYIIFFYVDIVKLPPHLAATGMVIYAIWNAINDPLVGYLSDHTHSRWGRRIPYIVFGAIPFGFVSYMLWRPPFVEAGQVFPLFLYFVFFICLFDAFYTITILNWSALYPEMFPHFKERTKVNAFRQTFGLIGLVLGVVSPPLIFSTWGWGTLGIIFGCAISISLLIAVWGSREHLEYSQEKQLPLFASFKATIKNKSFLTFVFSNLFVQYSFTLILATIPFFMKYLLDEPAHSTAAVLAVAFLAAIPMLYVWQQIVIRFSAKKSFMLAMVVLAFSLLPLFFVQTFAGALFTAFLLGIGLSGFIEIVDLVISDVIDEDETKTGTRREGMYFGANAFITRFAIGLEAISMGLVFVWTGYNPYIFTQTPEFLIGLRALIAGLPLIAILLALLIISFYPLFGQGLKEMKTELKKIHLKKGVT